MSLLALLISLIRPFDVLTRSISKILLTLL